MYQPIPPPPDFSVKEQRKSIMNHNSVTLAVDNAAEGLNIRAFLQQAVDHYPRLVAFSFTALLPCHETMTDKQALITRFHTEVWQRIGEYSWQRQQSHQSSPPTILRWIWGAVDTAECKMVLLMNFDTLGAISNVQLIENAQHAISEIIQDVWLTVMDTDRCGVMNITPIIVNRTGKGAFSAPFNKLQTQVQAMCQPVTTAKTGGWTNTLTHSR